MSGDLLRQLRHELRTPINHIVGFAELLLEQEEDQGGSPYVADLRRILSAGRALLHDVDEILAPASGLAEGTLDLAWANFRLRTPLAAVSGYCELLLDEAAESGRADLLPDVEKIHTAATHLLTLVNAALDTVPGADEWGAQRPTPTGPTAETQSGSHPVREGTLLVVDDNESNREILERRLTRLGYTVHTASNGREGLEWLRQYPCDLLLLDIMMPELDGFEVLRRLKADSTLRELPVIVLSALDSLDDVVACLQLGADDYLAKPYNPTLLLARIGAILEKKRLRDQEVEYLRRVAPVTGPPAIALLLYRKYGVSLLSAESEPSFSDDELALLADLESKMEWVTLDKGAALMEEGAPSDAVYFLVYGRLQAVMTMPGGDKRAVGEIQHGETVGEWGIITGRPRTATVVATRDSRLACVSREGFARLSQRHPRVLTRALQDYTLPVVSMIAARRYVATLQKMFGTTRLEDLWLSMFAISSNLTRAETVQHRCGLLWRAIRASCSIPGVMPPVPHEGDLLVDGGVLNNLPVDVMQERNDGGPVIASDLRVKVDLRPDYRFGESLTGTEALWTLTGVSRGRARQPAAPGIVPVLTRATLLASVNKDVAQIQRSTLYLNPPVGRFPLLDGRDGREIFRIGYEYARKIIHEDWATSGKLDRLLASSPASADVAR